MCLDRDCQTRDSLFAEQHNLERNREGSKDYKQLAFLNLSFYYERGMGKSTDPKMCTGESTSLACGHKLIHYISYCHEHIVPCEEGLTSIGSLDDSCANCHPPFLIKRAELHHEAVRSILLKKMREACSKEEVSLLQKELHNAERERRREVRHANSIRWNGIVEWPNKEDDEQKIRRRANLQESSVQNKGATRKDWDDSTLLLTEY